MGFRNAVSKVVKGNVNSHSNYAGISREFYPKASLWVALDSNKSQEVLDDLVEDFYYVYYWYKLKGDAIHQEFIAELIFHMATLWGKRQAVKKAQRVLNITSDGVMGDVTIEAINNSDPKAFINNYLLEAIEFYTQAAKRDPSNFRDRISSIVEIYYDAMRRYS